MMNSKQSSTLIYIEPNSMDGTKAPPPPPPVEVYCTCHAPAHRNSTRTHTDCRDENEAGRQLVPIWEPHLILQLHAKMGLVNSSQKKEKAMRLANDTGPMQVHCLLHFGKNGALFALNQHCTKQHRYLCLSSGSLECSTTRARRGEESSSSLFSSQVCYNPPPNNTTLLRHSIGKEGTSKDTRKNH